MCTTSKWSSEQGLGACSEQSSILSADSEEHREEPIKEHGKEHGKEYGKKQSKEHSTKHLLSSASSTSASAAPLNDDAMSSGLGATQGVRV